MFYMTDREKKRLEKASKEEDMSQSAIQRKALTWYLGLKLSERTFIIKK